MSKAIVSPVLPGVISLDINAMSLPPHFSAGSVMVMPDGPGCHRGDVTAMAIMDTMMARGGKTIPSDENPMGRRNGLLTVIYR